MAEIFYNGKIYVGALSKHEYENVFNEGSDKLWVEYLNEIPDIRKYPVIGTHSFKDGQDVTRLYKLEHQLRSYNPDKEEWYKPAYLEDFHTATAGKRIVAIPATPPDELDQEAKELVGLFSFLKYNQIKGTKIKGNSSIDLKNAAEQCAIIHCDLMIEYLNKNRLSNYANHYTTLKQKIEAL